MLVVLLEKNMKVTVLINCGGRFGPNVALGALELRVF